MYPVSRIEKILGILNVMQQPEWRTEFLKSLGMIKGPNIELGCICDYLCGKNTHIY